MKLYEYQGKELFENYGILIPKGIVVRSAAEAIGMDGPYAIKAQTLSGDRKKMGGILFADTAVAAKKQVAALLQISIGNETIEKVIIEKKISIAAEYYVSITYDTDTRGPVLALSKKGGSGIAHAQLFPIDPLEGMPAFIARNALKSAGFASSDIAGIAAIVQNLWQLFDKEYALLAEINPLIKTTDGTFIAADAKIILDDEKYKPSERRFIEMPGDIAILASGGGASLLNIDALLLAGGKPANYTEYSGNPPAGVVSELTQRVLSRSGLKGCWVIGGTANFTDIYETMRGFLEGLQKVSPRPHYPIVIRRDGPRQKEAMAMLHEAAKKDGYDFHIYGSEISMAESAKIMVKLCKKKAGSRKNR